MINAQITNAILGMTSEQIPFVQFEFQYFKEGESTPSKAATRCIFLLNSDSETLDNSSMARSLVTLFMIAGAPTWNDIIGKVVRIEVNEQGIAIAGSQVIKYYASGTTNKQIIDDTMLAEKGFAFVEIA